MLGSKLSSPHSLPVARFGRACLPQRLVASRKLSTPLVHQRTCSSLHRKRCRRAKASVDLRGPGGGPPTIGALIKPRCFLPARATLHVPGTRNALLYDGVTYVVVKQWVTCDRGWRWEWWGWWRKLRLSSGRLHGPVARTAGVSRGYHCH